MTKYLTVLVFLALLIACGENKPKAPETTTAAPTTMGIYAIDGDSLVLPPFEIELTVSTKADGRLTKGKETIIVDATFSAPHVDSTKNEPGGYIVAESTREVASNTRLVRFENIKFPKRLYDSLAEKDIELLVNVYSGRKSSPDNLISCGIASDKASVFKDKKYKIDCKLIEED